MAKWPIEFVVKEDVGQVGKHVKVLNRVDGQIAIGVKADGIVVKVVIVRDILNEKQMHVKDELR